VIGGDSGRKRTRDIILNTKEAFTVKSNGSVPAEKNELKIPANI